VDGKLRYDGRMIFREMPRTWDPAFRPRFYSRWGRESAVIAAAARSVEYPNFTQLLSIKAAFGGVEEYFVDGQRIAVDDDTFLILNSGRTYGSRIKSIRPVQSYSIFFGPGLLEEVQAAARSTPDVLLDDRTAVTGGTAVEFAERLYEHDRSITPVLRHIHRHVSAGFADELWVEEQLRFLLHRMLRLHGNERLREADIPSTRASTRRELYRRLGLGVSFIHTCFREKIGLERIASAAHLSPFHFLRTFKAVFGTTPSAYLNHKRTRVALRMLATTALSVTEIADHVGFGARSTLFRHLRAAGMTSAIARRSRRATELSPGFCAAEPALDGNGGGELAAFGIDCPAAPPGHSPDR
jgi:AraC family transcriptional regulator